MNLKINESSLGYILGMMTLYLALLFEEFVYAPWWVHLVLTWIFFQFLLLSMGLATWLSRGIPLFDTAKSRPWIRDLWLCQVSILIFCPMTPLLLAAYQAGWIHFDWHVQWPIWFWLPIECIVLFLINEIHFYWVHRMLHLPRLFAWVHAWHHRSRIPTAWSTYAFHPVEAFLLGTVIAIPLATGLFSPLALIVLPVLSLALNMVGHSSHIWSFPGAKILSQMSQDHFEHHFKNTKHYGFALGLWDRWWTRPSSSKPQKERL